MLEQDLISIIVPCYNSENCVDRCINSIFRQTYTNYEILAINDGSKDNTLELLNELAKKNNKLKVIDKENGGAASARNKGLELAKGKYLMFIDADDYIGDNFVKDYYDEIISNDYDMVLGGYTRLDDNLKVVEIRKIKNKCFSTYKLLSPWARIIKREFLIKNNISFLPYDMGEDVFFCMKILLNTDKVKAFDNVDYYYIYSNTSLTSTKFQDFKISQKPLLDSIIKECNNKNDKRYNYFMYRYVIYYLLTFGKRVKPSRFIEEAYDLYNYLKKNGIKSVSVFSKAASGDDFKVKVALVLFKIMFKLRLISLFGKIYCKSQEIGSRRIYEDS